MTRSGFLRKQNNQNSVQDLISPKMPSLILASRLLEPEDGSPLESITVKVTAARLAPQGFGSPILLDIDGGLDVIDQTGESIVQAGTIPANITMCRDLSTLFGDDWRKWSGITLKLNIVPVSNPVTRMPTRGFRVAMNDTAELNVMDETGTEDDIVENVAPPEPERKPRAGRKKK